MSNDTRPCYYPDHTEATADVPCTGDKYTSCCLESDICLSNGFCIAITTQPFVVTRGSCTNQGWDSGCPTHCGMSFLSLSLLSMSIIIPRGSN